MVQPAGPLAPEWWCSRGITVRGRFSFVKFNKLRLTHRLSSNQRQRAELLSRAPPDLADGEVKRRRHSRLTGASLACVLKHRLSTRKGFYGVRKEYPYGSKTFLVTELVHAGHKESPSLPLPDRSRGETVTGRGSASPLGRSGRFKHEDGRTERRTKLALAKFRCRCGRNRARRTEVSWYAPGSDAPEPSCVG